MILARELQLQRRSLRKIQASTEFEPLKNLPRYQHEAS